VFTAATAGTPNNRNGINGSYTFTVKLNKGLGTELITKTLELTIIATAYTGGGHSGDGGGGYTGGGNGGGYTPSPPAPTPTLTPTPTPTPTPTDIEAGAQTPAAPVTVNPFTDIREGDWFYADIMYGYLHKLFSGTAVDKFSPDMAMTRGMLVTVLGRHYGVNVSKYGSVSFDDVDGGQYYTPYIEWARQTGIVLGIGDNKFDPDAPITRQDLAVLLIRYTDFAPLILPMTRDYKGFIDEADIANYAKEANERFFKADLISGYPDGSYKPHGLATRAEIAAILHRLLEATKEQN